ncbi:MAG: tetratricopeptide repeat protein [Alistipes sp.]|nr:tetratricopeptide repeat protein [Alistipes sp.]
MKHLLISLCLLLASAVQAQPADSLGTEPRPALREPAELTPGQLWDAAGTAYINGNFVGAVEAYEQLLDRGLSSAKLYYNLGNAYFKSDRTGKAVLAYRRALRLAPGNEDVRYNLSVAEARTKDDIEQVPEFFLSEWLRGVRQSMSCTAWSILSLAALAAALALVLLYLLAQRLVWRKAGFYGMLVAVTLFVAATSFAAGGRREMLDRSQAVVMVSSTAVKSSPDKSATDLFVLHEGTVLRITEELDGWCEITIADGKKGWLESRKIERI